VNIFSDRASRRVGDILALADGATQKSPLTPEGGQSVKKNSQWLFLAIGSAGALAKMG